MFVCSFCLVCLFVIEDKIGFQSLEQDYYYIKTLMMDMRKVLLEHPMGDWVESRVNSAEVGKEKCQMIP